MILATLDQKGGLLRIFLQDTLGPRAPKLSLQTISVGTVIRVTPLTIYDSLRQLVAKVNQVLKSRGVVDLVDESLVEVRDAIAHGRNLREIFGETNYHD